MKYVILALVCVIVTWYVVQSCTETRSYTHFLALQDSLTNEVTQSRVREENARLNARTAFTRGLNAQSSRVIVRTVYRKDTAANHRLTLHAKDSVIKHATGLVGDTTKFTDPMANKVLDIESVNKELRAELKIDSVTIGELMGAYYQLDTASEECHKQVELLTLSSKESRDQVRKERKKTRLWQVAAVVALVLACL